MVFVLMLAKLNVELRLKSGEETLWVHEEVTLSDSMERILRFLEAWIWWMLWLFPSHHEVIIFEMKMKLNKVILLILEKYASL